MPLDLAGAISEIYMGAVTEEMPTPIPPKKRKIRNVYQLGARAVPSEESRYKPAMPKSVFLRPYLSEGIPPNKAAYYGTYKGNGNGQAMFKNV